MGANVYLAGASGSGKSTIAPLLARALGYTATDIDTIIVERAGMTIPAIFAESGEAAFRAIESEAVALVANTRSRVVALGGGTMLAARNVVALRASGTIVYLRAKPTTLWRRLSAAGRDERPLLANADDGLARVEALLAAREPGFAYAHRIVDVDDTTPEEVAQWIARGA